MPEYFSFFLCEGGSPFGSKLSVQQRLGLLCCLSTVVVFPRSRHHFLRALLAVIEDETGVGSDSSVRAACCTDQATQQESQGGAGGLLERYEDGL